MPDVFKLALLYLNFIRMLSKIFIVLYFALYWIVNSKHQNIGVFEGTIQYSYLVTNSKNIRLPFPIISEKVHIDEDNILFSPSGGIAAGKDIYLSKNSMKAYEIDHLNSSITILNQQYIEVIKPIEFRKTGDAFILEHRCDVYSLKYVHSFAYIEQFIASKSDTLTCTYFVPEIIRIPNATYFSRLQGNNNSLLLDGRFNSIPLKVEITKSNGVKIVIEATKVESKEVSDKFVLPSNYTLSNP
jgi:hypothetical protein